MLIGGRIKLFKASLKPFQYQKTYCSAASTIEYADTNKIRSMRRLFNLFLSSLSVTIIRDRYKNLSDSELVSFLALTMITEVDSAGQFDWMEMRKLLTKAQARIVAYYSCDEVIIHEGGVIF
jgi:hypothetical protein